MEKVVGKTGLIGQILIIKGLITNKELEEALNIQKKEGGLLGDALINLGFISEESLSIALCSQADLIYIPIGRYTIAKDILKLIPKELACKYCFIPLEKIGGVLTIAIANPFDEKAINAIQTITHYKVVCLLGTKTDIEKVINTYY